MKKKTRKVDIIDPESRYPFALLAHEPNRLHIGDVGESFAIVRIPFEWICVRVYEPFARVVTHRS